MNSLAAWRCTGFQYPLRAYGLWNAAVNTLVDVIGGAFSTLCGPMGCGTVRIEYVIPRPLHFQYPLRAYGLWNGVSLMRAMVRGWPFSTLCGPMGCGTHVTRSAMKLHQSFQYPLRAYGLWNTIEPTGLMYGACLSVPSAGLWAVERRRQCTTLSRWLSFSTLCGPMGCGTVKEISDDGLDKHFQYPLRAYGLWNRLPHALCVQLVVLSVPSAGLWAVEQ